MLQGPRYRQVLHGVHVAAAVPASAQLSYDAARLLLPGAVASHHLAAELLGAPVPACDVVHMAVRRPGRATAVLGLLVHRIDPGTPLTCVDGRWTTGTAVTFLGLAAYLGMVDLVVLGDAVVRSGRTTAAELVMAAASTRGRGVRLARVAAALVRAGVDSPMETRLRLLLVLARLPEPAVNVVALAADGSWLARPDLVFRAERVLVEYDGRHHRDRAGQWERDLRRRERLESHGWRVIVVTAQQLYRDPAGVVRRVAAALRERGTDVHPTYGPLWRALVAAL